MDKNAALTLKRAAEVAGVSRDTIKRRNAAGEFPNAYQDERGTWMIPEQDLARAGIEARSGKDEASSGRLRDLEQQLELTRTQRDAEKALREAAEQNAADLRLSLQLIAKREQLGNA
jgi:predicted site-specific integrase-resolvase